MNRSEICVEVDLVSNDHSKAVTELNNMSSRSSKYRANFTAMDDPDLREHVNLMADHLEHDHATPPPSKKRKTNKYVNQCRAYEVPYPNVTDREAEHLDMCQVCRETWPLFYYQQHHEMRRSFEEVSAAWMEMPETERRRKNKVLIKAENQWIRQLIKTRPPNGYQIFLKEQYRVQETLQQSSFRDRNQHIAHLWKSLSPEITASYTRKAMALKEERSRFIACLPAFKRRRYESAKKKEKDNKKAKRPPKPRNTFMLYLTDRWAKARTKGTSLKYRDVMQLAANDWKTIVTEAEKQKYQAKFEASKLQYETDKKRLEENTIATEPPSTPVEFEPLQCDTLDGGTDDEGQG